jgi:hypothetical protein
VNGKPVHRIPQWTDELERIGVGGKIQLTLKRDDKEISIELSIIDARRMTPVKQEVPAAPKEQSASPKQDQSESPAQDHKTQ